MTPRSFPAAALALLVATLAPGVVTAKIPDPRFSEIASVVVGSPSGAALPSCGARAGSTADLAAGFRVLVRDVSNAPLYYQEVKLDFSRSAIHLLGDDRPGTTVDCTARTITRFTDRAGIALFAPRFCGSCPGDDVLVSVDGVWLRLVPARSTDVDGDGTTGLLDFSRVAHNFLAGDPDPATDFDPCAAGSQGRTTLSDLTLFAGELLRDARGTACP
jgi:hypothetical protein